MWVHKGTSTWDLYSSTKWLGAMKKHTVATRTRTGDLLLPLHVLLVSTISLSVPAKSERQALLIAYLPGEETEMELNRKHAGTDHDAS